MRQLILDIRPDAPPTLGNYLPGANLEAYDALCAVAEGRAAETVIYLWGPPGAGKTHLLRAVAASVRTHGQQAQYVPAGESLPEAPFGLLAVDDVQSLGETGQIALFDRINSAREGQGVVLAAGDAAPARLPLRPDLTSRLSWGLVFALLPLDEENKLMAIAERARARGMVLPPEVARHLLTHCRRDLPNLLALVDALDDYSLSHKRPITLALLRSMLNAH
jgi:DnaA family protein